MNLRVLHVTNALPYEGNPLYGIFIKEQIDSLRVLGVECDIDFVNGMGRGKMAYLMGFLRFASWRVFQARRPHYDVVHCHHLLVGFIYLLCSSPRNVVVSFLSDGSKEFIGGNKWVANVIYRFVLKNASGRIFKKGIPQSLSGNGINFYLPNGVDIGKFREIDRVEARRRLGLDPSAVYLLFVSNHELRRPEKRYDRFREVLRLVREELPNERVDELLMVDVDRSEVAYYFNAANVHVLTSDFEGSPNSVKEALACNVPVVSVPVGNVAIVIAGLVTSAVSASFDVGELRDLVVRAVRADAGRENSRKNIVEQGLDAGSVAAKLKEIYVAVDRAGHKRNR